MRSTAREVWARGEKSITLLTLQPTLEHRTRNLAQPNYQYEKRQKDLAKKKKKEEKLKKKLEKKVAKAEESGAPTPADGEPGS